VAEITLLNPQALFAVPILWLLLVVISWRRRFKPFGAFLLRLVIIVLIILALAEPTWSTSTTVEAAPEEPWVLLVDQSASLGPAGQAALRTEAARLAQAHDQAQILFFADRAVLVQYPLSESGLEEDLMLLDQDVTNLAEALLLGGELLGDQPGRLVLLSDGLATAANTLEAVAQLAGRNIPVDVLMLNQNDWQRWYGGQNEVRVVKLSAPPVLRNGESYDVEVTVHSEAPAEATLNLSQNGQPLAEDVVTLAPGLNRFTFSATATEEGAQIFRATIAADGDRQEKNNALSAFARVYPAPYILIVGSEGAWTSRFEALLRETGFEATTIVPAELSSQLSGLEPYDGMVLMNVSAQTLELEQMIAIQEYVRSLGRGLVVIGGRNSFGPGRYEGTPLAELLPITMEPPPREERPPVALLLIIDHSGSMVEQHDSVSRLAMAKEAAIRATDILGPEDLVGILMFDNQYEWVAPFQQVNDGADLLNIQQRIARVPPGGGTRILQALEAALPALVEQETANSRLAVLLSDGKSFDGNRGIEDYNAVVDAAVQADITLSTIAIGTGADQDLMAHLAERGRGRYHYAETPETLPALTISESDILRSQALQQGDFGVAIFQPHPILRGLFNPLPEAGEAETPGISGYLAMTPKPRGEVALQVGPGDPLLSVWGYGLGRVVAWSSDTGESWAGEWQQWPHFSRFWGQVVGYTLPAPDLGLLQLETEVEPDGTVVLIADSLTATGQPVDLARTQATLLSPGGQENQVTLQQVAPGRYERRLRLPDGGAYQVTVTQPQAGSDEPATAATGLVVAYPAEYGLPLEGTGPLLLEQIATITGGRTFSFNELLGGNASQVGVNEATTEPVELWPWLLGAALALWPLEIAWRRWGRLRIQ